MPMHHEELQVYKESRKQCGVSVVVWNAGLWNCL
jgi:hypothetical protein